MGAKLVGLAFALCGCLAVLYGLANIGRGDPSGLLSLLLAAVLFGCTILSDVLATLLRIERQNKKP